MQLTKLEKRQFEERGFSRRSFGRLATLLAAGSTLPFYNEPALAQFSKIENAPPDAVMINANENPHRALPGSSRGRGQYHLARRPLPVTGKPTGWQLSWRNRSN